LLDRPVPQKGEDMPGNLKFDALKDAAAKGDLDTVLVAGVDMQGRLMGKRFHVQHFLDTAWAEAHCCNYLLATDMEMATVQGYASTSWQAGYGDYVMKPDLTTLRKVPWLDCTAMVLCDILDQQHMPVPHAPRAVLQRQIARARALGYQPMMATELEFYLFANSYDDLRDGVQQTGHLPTLQPMSPHNDDYALFQTTQTETVMRALRNGLYGAGIPVECTKGEADAGQAEINIRYSDALDTADNHVIAKQATREIAWSRGRSVTFMAKYDHRRAGSSSHVHQSLWADDAPAFHDMADPLGMSAVMKHFLAGQLAHIGDITAFLAPNVNSYKRFTKGMFAPTKAVWSCDNRTAGFRVCGAKTKAVRVECRIGGADLNPYLAMAALLAAGLDGIERALPLEQEAQGDLYTATGPPALPATLRDAAARMQSSAMLRDAFGQDVIDHYHHAALWEVAEDDRVVSDFERARLLERA
jgi:glutamine synthetase